MFDRWKELLIELQFAEEKTDANTIDAVGLTLVRYFVQESYQKRNAMI